MSDKSRTNWDIHVLPETRTGITAVANATQWPLGYVLDWMWRNSAGQVPMDVADWKARMKEVRHSDA